MSAYLFIFISTFVTIIGCALLVNYSKKRLQRSRHGLTGMCHKTGGAMCCSCADHLPKSGTSPVAKSCATDEKQQVIK